MPFATPQEPSLPVTDFHGFSVVIGGQLFKNRRSDKS